MNALHSFSTSSRSYTLGLQQGQTSCSSTLFNENDYTRTLNQLLLLELGIIDLYSRSPIYFSPHDLDFYEHSHRRAAQTLVNLIIANRGIPKKEGVAIVTELSIFASRLSNHFGRRLARQTAFSLCLQMEKLLSRRYLALIEQAPLRDHEQLSQLNQMTRHNIDRLSIGRQQITPN